MRERATLLPELRRRLAGFTARALSERFEKNGLPFAPIARPQDLFDDPHLRATGGLADIRIPDGKRAGETTQTALAPLMMDGQRLGVRLQPPTLGEHTQGLLASLGYDDAAIAALRASGAVA